MCEYLEKFGGYKAKPEMGMLMWLLAHMMDSAQAGDHRMMKEFLALTVVCVEQSVLDGDWNLAYVLSLLEEPPHHVFSEKPVRVSSLGRPFGALVPGPWAAVALAYLKEVDLITTRKTEAKTVKPVSPSTRGLPRAHRTRPGQGRHLGGQSFQRSRRRGQSPSQKPAECKP